MKIYYDCIVRESSDEVFRKDLLKLILDDTKINPVCPLTRKAIKVPAISNLGEDDTQLFEFEALLKHVREKGTHPILNKPMGEEHIYSCFSAYRLVKERLQLLLQQKDNTKEVDEESWQELEKFHNEIKSNLAQIFNNERERLKELRNQASTNRGVIGGRAQGGVGWYDRMQARINSDPSYAQLRRKLDLQGEKNFDSWYDKRMLLLEMDSGSDQGAALTLRKALKEIKNNPEPRVRQFFESLLLQEHDGKAELKLYEKLTDLDFRRLLDFFLDHLEMVNVVLDTAQQCGSEKNFRDKRELLINNILLNHSVDQEIRDDIRGLLVQKSLVGEVAIIFSLVGV